MHSIIHQKNFSLLSGFYPKRIISLVPSQTELLSYLGLDERVIGITKYCVHPTQWHQIKNHIGGTKNVNVEKIEELKPDLIIANKEENVQEQIEELATICPVYVSDVADFNNALEMILQVGLMIHAKLQSELLVDELFACFGQLQEQVVKPDNHPSFSTAYLIWRKPFMAAGGGTFINDMLQRCGLHNVFSHLSRYPSVTVEDLQQSGCRLLLLSSEPYPFRQKHLDELQAQLPKTKILLVDGEMFSWYGSHLLKAPAYFKQLLSEI